MYGEAATYGKCHQERHIERQPNSGESSNRDLIPFTGLEAFEEKWNCSLMDSTLVLNIQPYGILASFCLCRKSTASFIEVEINHAYEVDELFDAISAFSHLKITSLA